MPKEQLIPVTFGKGLVTEYEASVIPDGTCAQLRNYEPLPNGGVRVRRSWRKGAGTSPPSSRRTRGISSWVNASGVRQLLLAVDDNSANMSLYHQPWADLSSGAFTSRGNIAVTTRTLPVAFASGATYSVIAHPGFPNGRLYQATTGSYAAIAVNNIGGRCIAFHLNRFWTGGALTAAGPPVGNPSYLRFSELADPTNWNTTENFLPVSQDDGEAIEDLAIFDKGLLVGKQNSLHYLVGNSPDNFSLVPIANEYGCYPGRTLVSSPYGIFCISQFGVYLWAGGLPRRVSDALNFSITGAYATGAFIRDRLYVVDSAGPIHVYDPMLKIWWQEDYGGSSTNVEGPHEVFALQDQLVGGTLNATANGPILFRKDPGGVRTVDEGQTTTYVAETQEMMPLGALGETDIRGVYVLLRQHGGTTGQVGLTITPTVDNTALTAKTVDTVAAGTIRARKDFGGHGNKFKVRFSQASTSANTAVMDIEAAFLVALNDAERR